MSTLPATTGALVTNCAELLAELRCSRGFDAAEVLAAKVGRLSAWFGDQGLDTAVVGLSGGIDSATVLGLLERVRTMPGSPLRRVVALIVPIDAMGATGQKNAETNALAVADHFVSERWVVALAAAHRELLEALQRASGLAADGWSAGQMVSVERTPVLYGSVALLTAAGHRPVVVGTTNRDEGAYLGFFGKASDGAVDLQPISDLHKSEVRALATELGIPQRIIDAAPKGDVWDGRSDEAMIGASYDEVEMVLRLLELGRDPRLVAAVLDDGDRLVTTARAVDELHRANGHKYAVGSPAVHLGVMPRGVPGGWTDEQICDRTESPPSLPGLWIPPSVELAPPAFVPAIERRERATIAANVLDAASCALLLDALVGAPTEAVGVTGVTAVTGVVGGVGEVGLTNDAVGSLRSTAFDPALAAQLWARLRPAVADVRFLGPFDPTDGYATSQRPGHRSWRVVGLSPVLRFMRYSPGGRHLCHYDAAYEYSDGRRTLSSVVFFLSGDGGVGGALRFVHDGQRQLTTADRNHDDWNRDTRRNEVADQVSPRAGTAVVFDHRRCHDVERWDGPGDRVVIRADVVYEPIPDGRGNG